MKTRLQKYKTIGLSSVFAFLIFSPGAHCADVTLYWQQPNDCRVTGYKIYFGQSDTNFKARADITIYNPEQTSCVVPDLKEGEVYSFAAKSFDSQGNESDFSETIQYCVTCRDSTGNDMDISNTGNGGQNGSGGGGGGCFIGGLDH